MSRFRNALTSGLAGLLMSGAIIVLMIVVEVVLELLGVPTGWTRLFTPMITAGVGLFVFSLVTEKSA